jgi:hypothetical protein
MSFVSGLAFSSLKDIHIKMNLRPYILAFVFKEFENLRFIYLFLYVYTFRLFFFFFFFTLLF